MQVFLERDLPLTIAAMVENLTGSSKELRWFMANYVTEMF